MTGFNMHQQASIVSFSPHNQLIVILASAALRPVFILLFKLLRGMLMWVTDWKEAGAAQTFPYSRNCI